MFGQIQVKNRTIIIVQLRQVIIIGLQQLQATIIGVQQQVRPEIPVPIPTEVLLLQATVLTIGVLRLRQVVLTIEVHRQVQVLGRPEHRLLPEAVAVPEEDS